MDYVMKPQPGECWRATYVGIVQPTTPSVDAMFAMKAANDRTPEEFWEDAAWTFEKVADAPQPEPGPGSIVLDANDVVWRRHTDPDNRFPWSPAYGGRCSGGYTWNSEHPYTRVQKPVRVLLDPTKDDQ